MKIEATVPDEFIDDIAEEVVRRVVELVEARRAENHYMDVRQAALYLCCSKGRLYTLARQREIPCFKFGGRLLFSSREIDEWLVSHRVGMNLEPSYAPSPPHSEGSKRGDSRRRHTESRRKVAPPPPLSFSEEQRDSAAKALGLTRSDFDQLSPRQYDLLWKERVSELETMTAKERELLFDWDPNVSKLAEMTVAEMKKLAVELADRAVTKEGL